MKILIYGINYAPEMTGIGKYSGEMAGRLAIRGHEVRVVTAPPYYPEWQLGKGYRAWRYSREKLDGVDIWRCPLWIPQKPSGLKRILHLLTFALLSLPAMIIQLRWRPDVVLVVVPALFCAPGAAVIGRLVRARTWIHIQDFEVDAAFNMGLLRVGWLRRVLLGIERWLLRRFDRVSTISRRMLERLAAKGVPPSQLVFFPNWVDTDQIYPLNRSSLYRKELCLGKNEIVALYSGNMGQKQGLEIVIEAARKISSEKNVHFVLCGEGAASANLRRLAKRLQNVIWLRLQPADRLNELLNLADIHLLPQRADAADLVMPSKLTGIFASGRPVVATAAEGTEVWSIVNSCGVSTPPGDVNALAEAIKNFAHDPDKRRLMGMNARKYAEQYLDKKAVLERFEHQLVACCS